MRKTKIICTLGPKTQGIYEEMIKAGMDAARVNFSHETHKIHKDRINELMTAREKADKPIALMMDTKGPEIRLGQIRGTATLQNGHEFRLVTDEMTGDHEKAFVSYPMLYKYAGIGSSIYIDDGKIHLRVRKIENRDIVCEVQAGGEISSRKGVNVPGCSDCFPFMSKKDEEDIRFGAECGFDSIALSFVRTASDVIQVREILDDMKKTDMKIIAKIENRISVNNIDDIIDCSDGIMIGRGDLGIELSLEEVPVIQKKLIRKCYSKGKPVITATQMLESMTNNLLPTRAEVSDVANAIYDGTSAVMLSGETAMGRHPAAVIKRMADIIEMTESDIDYRKRFYSEDWLLSRDIVSVLGQTASVAAFELKAKAVVVITNSGNSARMISRFRPESPIIAITVKPIVERQLNMSWGIHPVRTDYIPDIIPLLENTINCAKSTGIVSDGDLIILTAGMPTGRSGRTNLMKIHIVGEPFAVT